MDERTRIAAIVLAVLVAIVVWTNWNGREDREAEKRSLPSPSSTAKKSAEPKADLAADGIELVDYEFRLGSVGANYAVLSGTVRNNSQRPVSSVWLKFDLFDAKGSKLGTVSPNTMVGPPAISSLEPGKSWSFTFGISGFAAKARSARLISLNY